MPSINVTVLSVLNKDVQNQVKSPLPFLLASRGWNDKIRTSTFVDISRSHLKAEHESTQWRRFAHSGVSENVPQCTKLESKMQALTSSCLVLSHTSGLWLQTMCQAGKQTPGQSSGLKLAPEFYKEIRPGNYPPTILDYFEVRIVAGVLWPIIKKVPPGNFLVQNVQTFWGEKK